MPWEEIRLPSHHCWINMEVPPLPDDIRLQAIFHVLQSRHKPLLRAGGYVILNRTDVLNSSMNIGNVPKQGKLFELFLQVSRERLLPELRFWSHRGVYVFNVFPCWASCSPELIVIALCNKSPVPFAFCRIPVIREEYDCLRFREPERNIWQGYERDVAIYVSQTLACSSVASAIREGSRQHKTEHKWRCLKDPQ